MNSDLRIENVLPADFQEFDNIASDLQLTIHDPAANAPEPVDGAAAPEVAFAINPPEVQMETRPLVIVDLQFAR